MCVLRAAVRRHQHPRTHAPSGASGSVGVGTIPGGVAKHASIATTQKACFCTLFQHADAVIAVCARQCRGSRCFLRALAATHAGASARAVKHPRTSAGCRVRRAARCASLCEAVLCGSLLHLLQAPGCERRATSYAVLACHDRTRQSVSLSQVRARLRDHRVAIEHAACAHRVEHLSG